MQDFLMQVLDSILKSHKLSPYKTKYEKKITHRHQWF